MKTGDRETGTVAATRPRRRSFQREPRSALVAGLVALPLALQQSSAQQAPAKIPRIGILASADSADTAIFDAFGTGLRDLGYVEGRNLVLEFRPAHGDAALLQQSTKFDFV